jgi:hypothetical protein
LSEKLPEQLAARLGQVVDEWGRDCWPWLAPYAWRNYIESGPGAVFVPFSILARNGGTASYIPRSRFVWMFPKDKSGLGDSMAAYDPHTSVLLVVVDDAFLTVPREQSNVRRDGLCCPRLLAFTPPPPALAAATAN